MDQWTSISDLTLSNYLGFKGKILGRNRDMWGPMLPPIEEGLTRDPDDDPSIFPRT